MNELIFFVSIIVFLSFVLLTYKLFGRYGLFAFVAFATVLANIEVSKQIVLFGLNTTAGSVLYASSFLCTDILSEKYGKKVAKKAVYIGILTTIMWIIGIQATILLKPSSNEFQESFVAVFGMQWRIALASLLGYVVSQGVDVFLYHAIWNKTGNSKKRLWLRNNGSTLVSQLVDTVIFVTIAFINTVPTNIFISILLTTYLFKAIIALLDTPFAYVCRMIKPLKEED